MKITKRQLDDMKWYRDRLNEIRNHINAQSGLIDPADPSPAAGWLVNAGISIAQAADNYNRAIIEIEKSRMTP